MTVLPFIPLSFTSWLNANCGEVTKGGGKRRQKSEIPIIFLSPGNPILQAVTASPKVQARVVRGGVGNFSSTVIRDKAMRIASQVTGQLVVNIFFKLVLCSWRNCKVESSGKSALKHPFA